MIFQLLLSNTTFKEAYNKVQLMLPARRLCFLISYNFT